MTPSNFQQRANVTGSVTDLRRGPYRSSQRPEGMEGGLFNYGAVLMNEGSDIDHWRNE